MTNNDKETARYVLSGKLGEEEFSTRVDFDGQNMFGIDGERVVSGKMSLEPVDTIGASCRLTIAIGEDRLNLVRFIPNNTKFPSSDEFTGREVGVAQGRAVRVKLESILD